MRYVSVFLAVLAALLLVALSACLLRRRMRKARQKVCGMCLEEKICRLNAALEPFGFYYEERDDSVGARMYPWQRRMGYCRAYDKTAVAMNIVVDCEPIYFNYGGRRYLIEFWKGQYGCAAGAEIGIYVNRERDFEKPAEELFYECADDGERLCLGFVLTRGAEAVLQRKSVHWWLAGFRVGMCAWPNELILRAELSFTDADMCRAFYEGLLRTGYDCGEICAEGLRVSFDFGKPRTAQYYRGHQWQCLRRKRAMGRNRRTCRAYCRATRRFCSALNRITYLGYCFPTLYRSMVKLGMPHSNRKGSRCGRSPKKGR